MSVKNDIAAANDPQIERKRATRKKLYIIFALVIFNIILNIGLKKYQAYTKAKEDARIEKDIKSLLDYGKDTVDDVKDTYETIKY